jgi:hypothetical protein
VKLLKQLLIYNRKSVAGQESRNSRIPAAADVPTLLGTGEFSLVECEQTLYTILTPSVCWDCRAACDSVDLRPHNVDSL